MQGAYPELTDSADARVAKVVEGARREQFRSRAEESAFDVGWTRRLQGEASPARRPFHLYETFGLPLDFMVDAARDAGVKFDDRRL